MLEKTGTKYDKIHIITDEQYEGVWNKLQLFRDFKKGPYLYLVPHRTAYIWTMVRTPSFYDKLD